MEHVEVLREMRDIARAAIGAGDWKVDGACDPDAALRRADAAIAALSAPKSGDWVLVPRGLLEAAVCPMKESGCDGTQYPVQPHGEGEQCQWCYERNSSLSAQQPAADGGFTAADMMDARQEGRKEAQQPAAVECDCPIGQAEHMSWCAISKAQDAQQGGRSDD